MNENKRIIRVVVIAFSVVFGVAAAFAEDFWFTRCVEENRYGQILVVSILSVLAGLYVHTIVHELGHLVFGMLTDYRFTSFRIGSVMLLRERGKLVLRRHSLPGTAGQCLMAPPPLVDGKMPVVLFNLGGCIANLVFSAMCVLFASIAEYGSVWEYVWVVVMLCGVLTAVTNGVPSGGSVTNDGANAKSLLHDEAARRAWWIQLEYNHRQAQGALLTGMPAEWFEMPAPEQMNNHTIAFLAVMRADRILAEGRVEEADRLMESLIAGDSAVLPLHRWLLQMERVWIELMGANRPEAVEKLLTEDVKKLMKAMPRYPAVIRTEYALAMLHQKDAKAAERCLKRFEKAAKRYAYRFQLDQERRLLEAVRQKAETA